jgi:hypothetical protein
MADDNNPQSRASDSSGRIATGGGQGSDPLAELARLIGQNDPFSEFGRNARAAAPAQQESAPRDRPHTDQEPEDDGAYDHPDHPGAADAYHASQDTPPVGQPERDDGGSYYRDASQMPPRDDFYDDVPPSGRRRGVITVIAVLALAVVGIAGAFGYRLMSGGSRSNAPPPIIMANPELTKVTPPAASNETPAGKLTYDRVGDRSQGERVITREETPVDRKDLTRPSGNRSAPSPSSSVNQRSTAVAPTLTPNSAAQLAAAPSSVLQTEPKKIRTVAIRPDQPDVGAGPPALAPPGAAARPQATMTPAPSATPSTARTPPAAPPAASTPATPPLRPAMAAVQPAPAPPNAPLALNDDTSPALPRTVTPPRPAPAAPPKSAAPAPQPTPAPSPQAAAPTPRPTTPAPTANPPAPTQVAAAASGGYLVQLSSQRSEAEAQAAFRSLQAKYPNVLGGRQAVVRRAELGERGVFFRAMVGPFASRDQASQFCGGLKAAGGDCIVQGN